MDQAEFKERVRKRAQEKGVEMTEQHEELLDQMAPDVVGKLEEDCERLRNWFDSKKSDWLG